MPSQTAPQNKAPTFADPASDFRQATASGFILVLA
jgi:hypothetical protein